MKCERVRISFLTLFVEIACGMCTHAPSSLVNLTRIVTFSEKQTTSNSCFIHAFILYVRAMPQYGWTLRGEYQLVFKLVSQEIRGEYKLVFTSYRCIQNVIRTFSGEYKIYSPSNENVYSSLHAQGNNISYTMHFLQIPGDIH